MLTILSAHFSTQNRSKNQAEGRGHKMGQNVAQKFPWSGKLGLLPRENAHPAEVCEKGALGKGKEGVGKPTPSMALSHVGVGFGGASHDFSHGPDNKH